MITNFHNPHKDYGFNKHFESDLKEALEKDPAYTAKPYLQGLLTATQLVMNSWEKDAFRSRQLVELGVDTKRKGPPNSTIPTKRNRANAPSNLDHLKATVGEHCEGISQDGIPRGVGSTPRLTKPQSPSTSRHQPSAVAKPRDSSKQEAKYGPGRKNSKFETTRFSDQDYKHHRGNRGHGGTILLSATYHV